MSGPPPLLELGGTGRTLHLAPANGFPLQTYGPALAGLLDRFRVVAIPPRALRPDAGPPPATGGSWATVAEDLVAGWRAHGLTDVVAVGHSFGAVASLIAARHARELVRGLAMLDPTILPVEVMNQVAEDRRAGREPRSPLAQMALKRRSRFGSHEEAFAYWRDKELFRDWSDAALTTYVHGMLTPAPEGDWMLAWPPQWEAWYYRSFYPHTWEDVTALHPSLPVLVVRGETSDTFLPPAAARLQAQLPSATFVEIPGAGHLFPQSHPEATGSVLAQWLASLP